MLAILNFFLKSQFYGPDDLRLEIKLQLNQCHRLVVFQSKFTKIILFTLTLLLVGKSQ